MKQVIALSALALLGTHWAQAGNDKPTTDSIERTGILLDEAVVTASKVGHSGLSIATSQTTLSPNLLRQAQATSFKDLSALAPNLYIPDFGSSMSTPIYIRGIGTRNAPAVGIYYDGVPLLLEVSFDSDLAGLSGIEVLRGAQGTLYGRGAMGGIINIVPRSSMGTPTGEALLRLGNYGTRELGVTHRAGGVSATFAYRHRDGFYTNAFDNSPVDRLENFSGRIKGEWQTRSGWTLGGFAHYNVLSQGSYPYAPMDANDHPGPINYNDESSYRRQFLTLGFKSSKQISEALKLRWNASYQYVKDSMRMDQDFTPQPTVFAIQQQEKNALVQELTLLREGIDKAYQSITGLYGHYLWATRDLDLNMNIPPRSVGEDIRDYKEREATLALYHQSSYTLWDRLRLEAGLRLELDYVRQDYRSMLSMGSVVRPTTLDGKQTSLEILPRASVSYYFNPYTGKDRLVYLSVQRGYKSGGFNTSYNTEEDYKYKPEYSWNYELGTRLALLERRLHVEASLFYITWRNQQIYQPIHSGQGRYLSNAGRSRSRGAELSLSYLPIEGLRLSAGAGYTDAEYTSYIYNAVRRVNPPTGGAPTFIATPIDYSGNKTQQVPNYTLNLGASYTKQLRHSFLTAIGLSANYTGVGRIYWDDANTQRQNPYGLLSAQLTLSTKYFDLGLWVRNALDAQYEAYRFYSLGRYFAQQGRPRQIGINLNIKW